ncbi:DUF4856 domain-containing protein [Neolewinella lacunae]|uniref:DUF4856 domain-containing protein n=1 Tax=Neolewinella lacunae TaxID=1517758 RepID=A0A923T7A9_9BACT|nr:DUF4856 domain-containing protein [Neolewinella lacunae]MBC6993384.1 DUF4856 domain-containing protein [Neolewinella lacunae]MDN3635158.1 DUF4856 domain-containing protein [Neolewinella lacunae]
MSRFLPFLLAFAGTFFFAACVDDDDDLSPDFTIPTTYDFSRAGNSTVSFTGQTERIGMASELFAAFLNFSRTETDLNNMFRNPEGVDPFASAALNAATKSVRSKVADSQALFAANSVAAAAIKADFDGWITAQVAEVFPNREQLASAGQPGQIADGSAVRYVNAWGLEYNQAFGKSLIGAMMYDQIANHYLTPAVLDAGSSRADNDAGITEGSSPYTYMEHRWDEAFGYLFGASATPATPLLDLGDTNDSFLGEYADRVDQDSDFAGLAAELETAFRTGRAAIVAGDYAERDRQAEIIRSALEKVIVVRAIFYLKQAEIGLRAQPADFGGAFHDLSEAYGFIYSLRFIDTADAATNSANYLTTLRNAGGNGFWDLSPDALASLADAIGAEYGVSVSQAAN